MLAVWFTAAAILPLHLALAGAAGSQFLGYIGSAAGLLATGDFLSDQADSSTLLMFADDLFMRAISLLIVGVPIFQLWRAT